MKHFYIYIHCKPGIIPFYVGKGYGRRSHEFKNQRNLHYKNVVAKYGKENIEIFVRFCRSEKQALKHEIWMIAYGRNHGWPLVNQTNGGDGSSGCIQSIETRQKRGRSLLGNTNAIWGTGMTGKTHTQESNEKNRASHLGRGNSPESKIKNSIASIKNWSNPLYREKVSTGLKISWTKRKQKAV